MHFTRKISVKHHPTGDHYSVSIPREIAQALGLQDGGGLVKIRARIEQAVKLDGWGPLGGQGCQKCRAAKIQPAALFEARESRKGTEES